MFAWGVSGQSYVICNVTRPETFYKLGLRPYKDAKSISQILGLDLQFLHNMEHIFVDTTFRPVLAYHTTLSFLSDICRENKLFQKRV